ncbi:MAG: hypothetical protein RLZZ427_1618 [Pseudomonadota bacterium]|jgi:hypothetical protein
MTWRNRVAAALREPIVHFMLAGAAVFVVLAGRAPDLGERRIVVNEATVARLGDRFVESFHREPTPAEIDGLINDYVREQIYYREALRLGLDRDDEIVMRRMRNKMIALATSEAEAAAPSDTDLRSLLDKDPGRYAKEPQITFTQLFLGADSPAARATALQAIAILSRGGDAGSLAQPAPLPAHFEATPGSEVAAQFGDEFAAALPRQPRGRWTTVTSGLGLHVVRVEQLHAPASPSLDAARQQLTNDWHNQAMRDAEDTAYRKIRAGYDVVIEQPK